jgi:hypothetical protein
MSSREIIGSLRRRYAMLRGAETLMLAIACGALVWSLTFIATSNPGIAFSLSVLATLVTFVVRAKYLGLFSLTDERIAFFLNRKFEELMDSSDLVLKPLSDLSDLEQIQLQRTTTALEGGMKVKFPHQLPISALVLLVTVLTTIALTAYLPPPHSSDAGQSAAAVQGESIATAELSGQQLLIQPPTYTGIKAIETANLSAKVPQGSDLTWHLGFNGQPDKVWLQFTSGDSLLLSLSGQEFVARRKIDESVIYRVRWNTENGTNSTGYFEITARPDEPPNVQIKSIEQFTRLKWGERVHVDVPVTLSDDFGLTQGHIIATVSKGSGESVKFREEKLPFQSPEKVAGTNVRASRRIDFKALGMEPGDEVYFYAEAWDNKRPVAQRNRTETYFISLQDTATQIVTVDASLGVDLMPEYFRSQRQIIIDTEKLLKDKPRITKQVFNSTSNELGYDQKVLRLKYGQFLGEEFETTIGETAHDHTEEKDDEEEEENDPAKKFGHQHDKDNEHNLVAPKKQEPGHEHAEEGKEEDLINAYRHEHDNMEEATFFTMSVRAKLKAALTLMWESELQLRLFAPRESLPIQYKILNLLREISQDSRIYVHRMGFDPPPLKEDRRLTGDLEEIGNPRATSMAPGEVQYPAIRKALPAIQSALEQTPPVVDDMLKATLEAAANELAAASLQRPGDYLVQLSQIRAIVDDNMNPADITHALEDIQAACWNILPGQEAGPNQPEGTRHALDAKLLEELKKPSND